MSNINISPKAVERLTEALNTIHARAAIAVAKALTKGTKEWL